jgi:hypothetical protein
MAVAQSGQIVWQYGDVLIAHQSNNRAIIVNPPLDPQGVYGGRHARRRGLRQSGPNGEHADGKQPPVPTPARAVRLKNGNTLISDQFNDRVMEITPQKEIVRQQGQLNVPGAAFDQINGPYDAKNIGDYTGLTPP